MRCLSRQTHTYVYKQPNHQPSYAILFEHLTSPSIPLSQTCPSPDYAILVPTERGINA